MQFKIMSRFDLSSGRNNKINTSKFAQNRHISTTPANILCFIKLCNTCHVIYDFTLFVLYSVDGSWSPWSSWDPCSETCDEGFQKRMRECTNPTPANGGKACIGAAMETKKCILKFCPGLN